jgi:uncharacterized protein (TIGR02246 family)
MEEKKDEIIIMGLAWKMAINTHDVERSMDLYNKSALLYATFKTRLDTPYKISQYFQGLFTKRNFSVVFNSQDIRIFSETVAINSGMYTFSYKSELGEAVSINARFTFVYLFEDGFWKIIEHHSSIDPE